MDVESSGRSLTLELTLGIWIYLGMLLASILFFVDALGDEGRLWLKILVIEGPLLSGSCHGPCTAGGCEAGGLGEDAGRVFGTKWSPVCGGMVTEAWD